MTPHASSTTSALSDARAVTLTDATTYRDWLAQTQAALTSASLAHLLANCPFEGDDALDPTNHEPIDLTGSSNADDKTRLE